MARADDPPGQVRGRIRLQADVAPGLLCQYTNTTGHTCSTTMDGQDVDDDVLLLPSSNPSLCVPPGGGGGTGPESLMHMLARARKAGSIPGTANANAAAGYGDVFDLDM